MVISTTNMLAYAAGVVDSEGWVGIGRNGKKNYYPEVLVGMIHEKTIKTLHDWFGFGRTHKRLGNKTLNCRDCYAWKCSSSNAIKLLKLIYPYMITKKEQAKYVLEFMGRRSTQWELFPKMGGDKGYRQVPQSEIQQREFFYNLLGGLNKKGYR